ncbi:NADH-quinone oxidoreductase subunit C [Helicobacter sp. 23-1045]
MQNLQKKVYHKNRFQTPCETPKVSVKNSKFEGILALMDSRIKIIESFIELGNLVVCVERHDILEALEILKDYGFDILSELSAIHLSDDRFEVFYQLLSMDKVARVRVKTITDKEIDSATKIYRNALWCEREAYDMFGIRFLNHPHLKRLIMPDDWSGHPLRKDYPLQGDEDAQWYEIDKIFGVEHRDSVGAENRDSAFVDESDTMNFALAGFEVPKGAKAKSASDEPTEIRYQEKDGVFVVTKFDKAKQKQLDKRR